MTQYRSTRPLSISRLRAMVLAGALAMLLSVAAPAHAADCTGTGTGLIPLTELGDSSYQGLEGGLYPGGSNLPPADHLALGLRAAAQVQPRAADGTPDPEGRIGIVSIGVSNTQDEFAGFVAQATSFGIDPQIRMVNGAQGSTPLEDWAADSKPWERLLDDLGRRLTAEQVQAAWIKLPAQNRGTSDLEQVAAEVEMMVSVVRIAAELFPNLQLVYLSSRTYGGYANRGGGEPKAYQHAFVVRSLIEEQMNGSPRLNADPDAGEVVAPWLGWGPYLWADGLNPRADGLVWECSDFTQDDGIHPAQGAVDKVGALLLEHFTTHPTTEWFTTVPTVSTTTSTAPDAGVTPPTAPSTTTTVDSARTTTTRDASSRPSDRPNRRTTVPDAADPSGEPVRTTESTDLLPASAGLAGLVSGVVLVGAWMARRRSSRPPL